MSAAATLPAPRTKDHDPGFDSNFFPDGAFCGDIITNDTLSKQREVHRIENTTTKIKNALRRDIDRNISDTESDLSLKNATKELNELAYNFSTEFIDDYLKSSNPRARYVAIAAAKDLAISKSYKDDYVDEMLGKLKRFILKGNPGSVKKDALVAYGKIIELNPSKAYKTTRDFIIKQFNQSKSLGDRVGALKALRAYQIATGAKDIKLEKVLVKASLQTLAAVNYSRHKLKHKILQGRELKDVSDKELRSLDPRIKEANALLEVIYEGSPAETLEALRKMSGDKLKLSEDLHSKIIDRFVPLLDSSKLEKVEVKKETNTETSVLSKRGGLLNVRPNAPLGKRAIKILLLDRNASSGEFVATVQGLISANKFDRKTEGLVANLLGREDLDPKVAYIACQYLKESNKRILRLPFKKYPFLGKLEALLSREDKSRDLAAFGALEALESLGKKAKSLSATIEDLLIKPLGKKVRKQVVKTFEAINPNRAEDFFRGYPGLRNNNYATKNYSVLRDKNSTKAQTAEAIRGLYTSGKILDEERAEIKRLLVANRLSAEGMHFACLCLAAPGGVPQASISRADLKKISLQLIAREEKEFGTIGALKALKSLRRRAESAAPLVRAFFSSNTKPKLRALAAETLRSIDPINTEQFLAEQKINNILAHASADSQELTTTLAELFNARNKLSPLTLDLIARRLEAENKKALPEKAAYFACMCLAATEDTILTSHLMIIGKTLSRKDIGALGALNAIRELGSAAKPISKTLHHFIKTRTMSPKYTKLARLAKEALLAADPELFESHFIK